MQVILLEKVTNLGKLGETVKVRPGYGRNFLIPRGKAVPATPENKERFEAKRAELEQAEAEALAAANERKAKLDGMTVTVPVRAGEEGKLFGSIGTAEIASAVTEAGVAVEKNEVRLPGGALRVTGEHAASVHLHPDVDAHLTINVVAEE